MNRIQSIKVSTMDFPKFVPDTYTFSPTTRMNIFEKIALWMLRGFKKPHIINDTVVFRVTVDTEDFMERLFKVKGCAAAFGGKPAHLLIGAETFDEMMGSGKIPDHAFKFNAEYYEVGYNGYREVLGLRVHVIPWMVGMAALPKDFLKESL